MSKEIDLGPINNSLIGERIKKGKQTGMKFQMPDGTFVINLDPSPEKRMTIDRIRSPHERPAAVITRHRKRGDL